MKRETPTEDCNASFIRVFQACRLAHNRDGGVVTQLVGHPHEMHEAVELTAETFRKYWPRECYGTVQVLVWKQ